MVKVPAQYQGQVSSAAQQLGIPESVVAAQINDESGFNPNVTSYAGAEGIAQFLPGTFREYGHGSPYNPDDAFRAYVNYMGTLLHQFQGNVRNALAAYNAGPGNLRAGYGYADGILKEAGQGVSVTSGKGQTKPAGMWDWVTDNPISNVLTFPSDIIKPFQELDTILTWWWTNKMRFGFIMGGSIFLIIGLVFFAKEPQ
ncbi:lytic transglycosylase domain-containing protein [Streptomyces olivoreticuli]